MPPADSPLMRSRFTRLIHWMKPGLEKLARPRRQQQLLVEMLEDRLVMNTAWGANGPPLSVNTSSISAVSVVLTSGDAGGSASITTKNEVDYFKFTTSAGGAGFYRLSATGGFDAMVGIYAQGSSGKLLGYADSTWSGTEQVTVYLEASKTYYLGVTNYLTSRPVGNYTWSIDDIDPSPGNPGLPTDQRILYVNFDGATLGASSLQAWDNDWQYGSAAEFDPNGDGVTILPFLAGNSTREQIISNVLNYVQQDLAGFGVRVVRLAAGSSAVAGDGATTIFVGPSTLEDKAASDPSRGCSTSPPTSTWATTTPPISPLFTTRTGARSPRRRWPLPTWSCTKPATRLACSTSTRAAPSRPWACATATPIRTTGSTIPAT